jgi:hypothetical protein
MISKRIGMLAGLLVMTGCSGFKTFDPKSPPDFVTVKPTKIFMKGPMQVEKPDELPAEAFVRLLKRDPGFCVVVLDDGRTGWVDSRHLRPAPSSGRPVRKAEILPERMAKYIPVFLPELEPDLKLPVGDVPENLSPVEPTEKPVEKPEDKPAEEQT